MSWDYSDLSHLAKQYGGPTELLAKHAAYHFKKGAESKNPIIASASLISLGVGIGGTVIYFNWKNKNNKTTVSEREIYKIEDELITEMECAEHVEATKEDMKQAQEHIEDNGNEDSDSSI